jgi:hypothetical protein
MAVPAGGTTAPVAAAGALAESACTWAAFATATLSGFAPFAGARITTTAVLAANASTKHATPTMINVLFTGPPSPCAAAPR